MKCKFCNFYIKYASFTSVCEKCKFSVSYYFYPNAGFIYPNYKYISLSNNTYFLQINIINNHFELFRNNSLNLLDISNPIIDIINYDFKITPDNFDSWIQKIIKLQAFQ